MKQLWKYSNIPVISVESICEKANFSQARDTKRFWWRLWTDNGRSREGEVYKCYKNVKNLFRKLLRQCVTSKNKELYESLYRLLKRVLKVSVKRTKKSKLYTNIEPSEFSWHFSGTMQDNSKNLSHQQSVISSCVENYNNLYDSTIKLVITSDQILQCIKRLKRNSSPGIDGMCGEFLINSMSYALSSHWSYFYWCMFSFNCVPVFFNTDVMVTVLKNQPLTLLLLRIIDLLLYLLFF